MEKIAVSDSARPLRIPICSEQRGDKQAQQREREAEREDVCARGIVHKPNQRSRERVRDRRAHRDLWVDTVVTGGADDLARDHDTGDVADPENHANQCRGEAEKKQAPNESCMLRHRNVCC